MPTDTRTALLTHALIGYEERKRDIAETIGRIRATLDGRRLPRWSQLTLRLTGKSVEPCPLPPASEWPC